MSLRVAGSAVIGIAAGAAVGLACAPAPPPPPQAVTRNAVVSTVASASDPRIEDLTRKLWRTCGTVVPLSRQIAVRWQACRPAGGGRLPPRRRVAKLVSPVVLFAAPMLQKVGG